MGCLYAGDVPAGRSPLDIFVLRVILHDWNDVKALQILRNVRSSIGQLLCVRTAPRLRQSSEVDNQCAEQYMRSHYSVEIHIRVFVWYET